MWLSFNILSVMVDLSGLDPDDVSLRLTMSTAETEGVERMNSHLDTIITAKLLDVKPHPNADKLRLCTVETESGEIQVVCGAPNARTGIKGIIALPGAYIPGTRITLEKGVIRGSESQGMLCSERELLISDEHNGIIEIDGNWPVWGVIGSSVAAGILRDRLFLWQWRRARRRKDTDD
mgnify:CR=1 FL=1